LEQRPTERELVSIRGKLKPKVGGTWGYCPGNWGGAWGKDNKKGTR